MLAPLSARPSAGHPCCKRADEREWPPRRRKTEGGGLAASSLTLKPVQAAALALHPEPVLCPRWPVSRSQPSSAPFVAPLVAHVLFSTTSCPASLPLPGLINSLLDLQISIQCHFLREASDPSRLSWIPPDLLNTHTATGTCRITLNVFLS